MRKHDWPEILTAKIIEWAAVPFEWGKTDCAMFVINVVNAMTDGSIVNRSIGMYETEFGAQRAILKLGDSLESLVGERFGEPVRPAFAQRGDVVLCQSNLGICLGVNSAFRTPDGIVYTPTLQCDKAWRVE